MDWQEFDDTLAPALATVALEESPREGVGNCDGSPHPHTHDLKGVDERYREGADNLSHLPDLVCLLWFCVVWVAFLANEPIPGVSQVFAERATCRGGSSLALPSHLVSRSLGVCLLRRPC